MKTAIKFVAIAIFIGVTKGYTQEQEPLKPIVISNDFHFKDGYVDFKGTDNLIFLPENRLEKKSRTIGIQFFRVKAKKDLGLPPVFYLPGGPGGSFFLDMFGRKYGGKHGLYFGEQVTILNETRDVLVINQRGNHQIQGAPIPDFTYRYSLGDPKAMTDPQEWAKNIRKGFLSYASYFQAMGIDLRGYDFSHLVDDLEAIREYYGYGKIAFMVGRFGAQ